MKKSYHSDTPIKTVKEDIYGRASFVEKVTDLIAQRLDGTSSYTIGLYAGWGYGKTSCLNLLESALGEEQDIAVVRINTWSFNGNIDELTWHMLYQIEQICDKHVTGKKKFHPRKSFKRFGSSIRKIAQNALPFSLESTLNTNESTYIKFSSGAIINSAQLLGNILSNMDNIKHLKERIKNEIGSQKIVIMLDDIDRLQEEQMLHIFRVISQIIDCPGITYVLAFDKTMVAKSIEKLLPNGESGAEYLDKIIQIPLEIPKLYQESLDRYFINELTSILQESSITINNSDMERFNYIYYTAGLNGYIKSPRDINRILNVLRFSIPAIHGEANIIDIIIIEIIHTINHALYQQIHASKHILIKETSTPTRKYILDKNDELRKHDFETSFTNFPDNIKDILKYLFPTIGHAFNGVSFVNNNAESLYKQQRIASENHFDVFFTLTLGPNSISDSQVVDILTMPANANDIANTLCEVVTPNNLSLAIRTIRLNLGKIINKGNFCCALIRFVNTINQPSKTLRLSPLQNILFLIDDILQGSKDKLSIYVALLKEALSLKAYPLIPEIIQHPILYSSQEYTEKRKDGPILKIDELQEYKNIALATIEKLAKQDIIPIKTQRWAHLLFLYWADLGNPQELERYIKKHIHSANDAIDFITLNLNIWSEMDGTSYYGDIDTPTYKTIKKFISTDYLYHILKSNNDLRSLSGAKKNELTLFSESLSNMIEPEHKKNAMIENAKNNPTFRKAIAQQFMFFVENDKEATSYKEKNESS